MSADKERSKFSHDINASLSSIMGAVELINEEWRNNQELVEKIIPLTKLKLEELDRILKDYYGQS